MFIALSSVLQCYQLFSARFLAELRPKTDVPMSLIAFYIEIGANSGDSAVSWVEEH